MRVWLWTIALLVAGCASTKQAADEPIASGGEAGSACGTDKALACAPGNQQRVRCQGRVWVDDGKCDLGQSCIETKENGVVTATSCAFPLTTTAATGAACSKLLACRMLGLMGECVADLAHSSQRIGLAAAYGVVPDIAAAAASNMWGVSGCVAVAKDCAAVNACFVPTCAGNAGGCEGGVAWQCVNGTRSSLNCTALGLTCIVPKPGSALCGRPLACDAVSARCQADIAEVCQQPPGGNLYGLKLYCASLGMGCNAGSGGGPPCVDKPPTPCAAASFTSRCVGNRLQSCVDGWITSSDCAATGMVCNALASDARAPGQGAECGFASPCLGAATCAGGRLTYCQEGKRVTLDCSQFGMRCPDASAVTANCVF